MKNRVVDGKEIIKKFRFYDQKINKLWAKKQKIEALLYMSLLVEFFVKDLIITFEKIVEGAAFSCGVGFNPRNLYSRDNIEDQPLGYLIKILNTYTKDKSLIKDLKYFSNIRNKCVHKLFEHKISKVNQELKRFNIFYYKLIIKLVSLSVAQSKLLKKSFKHICDDCFKKALPKVIKL